MLCADDTYRVEYGYMVNNSRSANYLDWVHVEHVDGVYAEDLAATVRRLGDRDRY